MDEIIIEELNKNEEIVMEGDTVIYEKDYEKLENKPRINNVELDGNKTLHELGVQEEGNYVEQVAGKGLSTNDFTNEYKQQIETNAQNIVLLNKEKADKDEIPTEVADLNEDSTHRTVTDTEKQRWNNKAETTDMPTKTSDLTNDSGFIDKNVNNLTNYTVKTNTGSLIDLSIDSTSYVVTLQLKNQDGTVISTDTIDLPLESVVVSGRFDNTTQNVILTLENGSEVDFSVADLVAGLQTEITSTNKLASDLVDDTNSGNKFVTTTEKNTWNGKYNKQSSGIPKTDLASSVQTSLDKADTALQQHQDISGKLDASKVKTTTSIISGDVYDVTYINTVVGDIETILTRLTTGGGVS